MRRSKFVNFLGRSEHEVDSKKFLSISIQHVIFEWIIHWIAEIWNFPSEMLYAMCHAWILLVTSSLAIYSWSNMEESSKHRLKTSGCLFSKPSKFVNRNSAKVWQFTLLIKLETLLLKAIGWALKAQAFVFVKLASDSPKEQPKCEDKRRLISTNSATLLVIQLTWAEYTIMRSFIILLFLSCASYIGAKEYIRVCYHTNWSQYRPGAGKFWPENIDADLCTHLVYSFAKINRNTDKLAMYEWNDDKLYPRFNALKTKNRKLKTLLAVGGWNHENANSPFSKMVRTAASRKVLEMF